MIDLFDFTSSPLSERNNRYGGRSGAKMGIVFHGDNWILKFPKNTLGMRNVDGLSYVTSPLNEYIGSQIFDILGVKAHDTQLGIYDEGHRYKVVCACRDFISDRNKMELIPYTAIRNGNTTEISEWRESRSIQPTTLEEIVFLLDQHPIFRLIPNAKETFWDMAIIDMLINNNDRNEDNWGVLFDYERETYKMSPVYDLGNCFYGKATEERMDNILNDKAKLRMSALNLNTVFTDSNDKPISIKGLMEFDNADLRNAIRRIYLRAKEKLIEVIAFINGLPTDFKGVSIISETRKKYYIESYRLRLEEVLYPAYKKLTD